MRTATDSSAIVKRQSVTLLVMPAVNKSYDLDGFEDGFECDCYGHMVWGATEAECEQHRNEYFARLNKNSDADLWLQTCSEHYTGMWDEHILHGEI